jgi:hypothetical protein
VVCSLNVGEMGPLRGLAKFGVSSGGSTRTEFMSKLMAEFISLLFLYPRSPPSLKPVTDSQTIAIGWLQDKVSYNNVIPGVISYSFCQSLLVRSMGSANIQRELAKQGSEF